MFEFWRKMKSWQRILLILMIAIIIIILVLFIKHAKTSKESYTTLNENSSSPIDSYVNSWINSVKNLYTVKDKNENFAQSRTLRDFNNYKYLDKNSIVTGKYR
jgi:flagellar biosynthesis/type III secretory pathway M-ring protein FliF/YscJ